MSIILAYTYVSSSLCHSPELTPDLEIVLEVVELLIRILVVDLGEPSIEHDALVVVH